MTSFFLSSPAPLRRPLLLPPFPNPNEPKLSIGKDATEDFEEIGHSAAANEMLAKYKIGALKGGDGGKAARKQAASAVSTGGGSSGAMRALQVLLPLLAVLAALLLPKLLAK